MPSSLEILLDMRRKAQALLDADKEAVEAIIREPVDSWRPAKSLNGGRDPASCAVTWTVSTATDSLASSPAFIAFVATVKDELRKDFLQSIERNEDGFREQLRRVLRVP